VYCNMGKAVEKIPIPPSASSIADEHNFEIQAYKYGFISFYSFYFVVLFRFIPSFRFISVYCTDTTWARLEKIPFPPSASSIVDEHNLYFVNLFVNLEP
jgi:hypothetical protein